MSLLFRPGQFFPYRSVHPGRIGRTLVSFGDREWCFWNVHNYGLSRQEVRLAINSFSADLAYAQAAPILRLLCAAGDWNFLADGETAVDVRSGSPLAAPRQSPAGTDLWRSCLGSLLEVSQAVPTHFLKRRGSLSRLDRTYLSTPSWVSRMCSLKTEVVSDVVLTFGRKLSDHCALKLSMSSCVVSSTSSSSQPTIPDIMCRSERFLELSRELCDWCSLETLDTVNRWRAHKSVFQEAARLCCNEAHEGGPLCHVGRAYALAHLSRCVIQQDVARVVRLLGSCKEAQTHLHIVQDRVELIDPESFDKAYSSAWQIMLNDDMQHVRIRWQPSTSQSRRCLKRLGSLVKLWTPGKRKTPIAAVRIGGDLQVTNRHEIPRTLARYWAQTFMTPHKVDEPVAFEYLSKWGGPLLECSLQTADAEGLRKLLGPCCPSWRSAWNADPEVGSFTLMSVADRLFVGLPMPESFGQSTLVCPPKPSATMTTQGAIVEPQQTRPLSLRNSDAKVITGVVAHALKPGHNEHVVPTARGFTAHRQLAQNAVDLDSAARACGLFLPPAVSIFWRAVLVMFDVKAAFPSVSPALLLILFRWLALPLAVILFIETLYRWNPVKDSDGNLLFVFLSGILQGCPLSGMLFTFICNAFLHHIMLEIDRKGRGRPRACADDLGACVFDIRFLQYMQAPLLAAEQLANLSLHGGKCFLVPCFQWSLALRDNLQRELALTTPAWASFPIVPQGEYLGFMLGPSAGITMWSKPFAKPRARADELDGSSMPLAVGIASWNSLAISCVSYWAQLQLPPPLNPGEENRWYNRLLHLPEVVSTPRS